MPPSSPLLPLRRGSATRTDECSAGYPYIPALLHGVARIGNLLAVPAQARASSWLPWLRTVAEALPWKPLLAPPVGTAQRRTRRDANAPTTSVATRSIKAQCEQPPESFKPDRDRLRRSKPAAQCIRARRVHVLPGVLGAGSCRRAAHRSG